MQEKNEINSNFFERISQIIDFYNIKNVKTFACEYLNYKSSEKINRLKFDDNKPSFEIINDISNKFENINVEWLVTGRGKMIKDYNTNNIIVSEPQKEYNKNKVCKECAILKEQIFNLNKLIRSYEKQIELLEEKLKACLETSPKKKAS